MNETIKSNVGTITINGTDYTIPAPNKKTIQVSVEDCGLLEDALWEIVGRVKLDDVCRVRGLINQIQHTKYELEQEMSN